MTLFVLQLLKEIIRGKNASNLVGRIGFEPMTNGLKPGALPAELTTQI